MRLYELPNNLKTKQDRETETMKGFWERELEKCDYSKERSKIRQEQSIKLDAEKQLLEAARQNEDIKPDVLLSSKRVGRSKINRGRRE